MAQTSDKISSLAAKLATLTPDQLLAMTTTEMGRIETARDIRSMAASLLRQDEVKGIRKLIQKVFA